MKKRLMTPGPTPVPESSLLEIAQPVLFHRGSEFRSILQEVHSHLQYVFGTQAPVAILSCSGTGGMEAALVSSTPRNGKVILLIAGRWGERWRQICESFELNHVIIRVPDGQAVTAEQLTAALREHPDATSVCATLCETSTGVQHDIQRFGEIVAGTSARLIVDAISGLGAAECRVDDWKIDLCVSASQKALMAPPGLAFVTISDKAAQEMSAFPSHSYYFDLRKYRTSILDRDTPYTPAVSLIRGQCESLRQIRARGMETIWRDCAVMAETVRAGIQAMGLRLFAESPSNALTVIQVPESLDGNRVLSDLESRFGVKLANGQAHLKGKIWRLSHMGYVDYLDLISVLAALEIVLASHGYPVQPGSAVTAAQMTYLRLLNS